MISRKTGRVCSIEWCPRPHKARGYCEGHDRRAKAGQDMDKPFIVRARADRRCSLDTCDEPHDSHGYCSFHAKRPWWVNSHRFEQWNKWKRPRVPIATCRLPSISTCHSNWGPFRAYFG